jgi:hypothetical protein
MDRTDMKKAIMQYILNEDDYKRIRENNSMYENMSYDDFLLWNNCKIDALDKDEISCLSKLIKYISSNRVNLIDMEDCGSWRASAFFYDMNADMCIVHDR